MLSKTTLATLLIAVATAFPGAAHAAGTGSDNIPPLGPTQPAILSEAWVPAAGDAFFVDTKENRGYLIHADGTLLSFPVATGQHRIVHYIGRTYDAATPEDHWIAQNRETQGDRITFGPDGTFFRLYAGNGVTRTAYGIHTHAYIQRMLSRENRYDSMGCILVSQQILDIIKETFRLNDDSLSVVTSCGFKTTPVAALTEDPIQREEKDL